MGHITSPSILLAKACHMNTARQDAEKYSFSLLGGVEKLPGVKYMCIGSYGELGPLSRGYCCTFFILLERTEYVGQMTDETKGEHLHSHSSQTVAVTGRTIPDMSFSATLYVLHG